MDAKGRVSLPAKYRKSLTSDGSDSKLDPDFMLVITLSYDNEVRVYTEEEYAKYLASLFANEVNGEQRFDSTDPDERRMNLKIREFTSMSPIDTAGRITIPENIRKEAGLGKKVSVEGAGEYLAIWDPARKAAFLDGEDVGGFLNKLVAKRLERIGAAS
jgi:division/cell wall cluster transcriptional repressor MraZ